MMFDWHFQKKSHKRRVFIFFKDILYSFYMLDKINCNSFICCQILEVLKGPETLDIVTGNSLGFDETVDTLAFMVFKSF